MKKIQKLWIAASLLSLFILWTVAVCYVDVDSIGPKGSAVGFATLNGWFHHLTGVNMTLYNVTDWLGLVPVAVCLAFAALGLCQWISRKSIFRVDKDLFILGGFYIVTIFAYLLFETVVINYRPVLIGGYLEASYPSSTTLLTLCVMSSTVMQLSHRLRHRGVCLLLTATVGAFSAFMVIGRLLSGVHWLSDIIGGVLLSGGLVRLYHAICCFAAEER